MIDNEPLPTGEIDFEQILQDWAMYAQQAFEESLEKKVYRVRNTRKGRKRGNGQATGRLLNTWYQNADENGAKLEFLQYGRFVDMGVGKGTSHTDRLVSKELRERPGRKRAAWYSKTKTHEIKTLREILAKKGVDIPLDFIENALTLSLTRTI